MSNIEPKKDCLKRGYNQDETQILEILDTVSVEVGEFEVTVRRSIKILLEEAIKSLLCHGDK